MLIMNRPISVAHPPLLARFSLVSSDTAARAPIHRGCLARCAPSPPLYGASRCVSLRPPTPPLIATPFASLQGLQLIRHGNQWQKSG